jgi:hypothetical protein
MLIGGFVCRFASAIYLSKKRNPGEPFQVEGSPGLPEMLLIHIISAADTDRVERAWCRGRN